MKYIGAPILTKILLDVEYNAFPSYVLNKISQKAHLVKPSSPNLYIRISKIYT